MLPYLKAIVPLVLGAASAFAAYAEDGVWDSTENAIIGGAITTAIGVFTVPNIGRRGRTTDADIPL